MKGTSRRDEFVLQLVDDIRAIQRCPGFEVNASWHPVHASTMAKFCGNS